MFLGLTRRFFRLVQTCGDVKYSMVASIAALDLLCRLLDVERNKGISFLNRMNRRSEWFMGCQMRSSFVTPLLAWIAKY